MTNFIVYVDYQLDAGVPERLILISRDERSFLIASYTELKRCLDNAYQELLARVLLFLYNSLVSTPIDFFSFYIVSEI